jgi:hypothetical protein
MTGDATAPVNVANPAQKIFKKREKKEKTCEQLIAAEWA